MILATTTSTQDSGLLDELIPVFERDTGYDVKPVAVGSGQAIEMGARGEADVVLAHSPAKEKQLAATAAVGERRAVMHNFFMLLGPESDPARARGEGTIPALERIASERVPFVSRGDDSGTHAFELGLWKKAGIQPGGNWYRETGQGQGQTLQIARETQAYTLSDDATYLATKVRGGLAVIVDGEPPLANPYHVLDITGEAGKRVNVEGGRAFADWIVSEPAQRIIKGFGKREYGQPLFVPDARTSPGSS